MCWTQLDCLLLYTWALWFIVCYYGVITAKQFTVIITVCGNNLQLRCIKEWPLYLQIWGNINHSVFVVWSRYLLLAIKLNLNYRSRHPVCKWRKKVPSESLQNLQQFLLQLGSLLLLQQRATLVVTWDLEICTCTEHFMFYQFRKSTISMTKSHHSSFKSWSFNFSYLVL